MAYDRPWSCSSLRPQPLQHARANPADSSGSSRRRHHGRCRQRNDRNVARDLKHAAENAGHHRGVRKGVAEAGWV